MLVHNPFLSHFLPSSTIWNTKIPPKIRVLAWIIAHWKANACYMVQRRRPYLCLSPHWCLMCKKDDESVDHLFLHCPVAFTLWLRLCRGGNLSWVIPATCVALFWKKHKYFGGRKWDVILGRCAMLAIIWVVWIKRNRWVFEDTRGEEIDNLWERLCFWASLWALVSSELRVCFLLFYQTGMLLFLNVFFYFCLGWFWVLSSVLYNCFY